MNATSPFRRWLSLYPRDYSPDLTPEAKSPLDHLQKTVHSHGQDPALCYFNKIISYQELDEMSNAFACALKDFGIKKGDRVALYLQNIPQFVIAQYGIWKTGGIVVPLNPMYKEKELTYYFRDASVRVLVCMESLYGEMVRKVVKETGVEHVITTSELDFLDPESPRPSLLKGIEKNRDLNTLDFITLIERYRGKHSPEVELSREDVAYLTYTSGTTGRPKGVVRTHENNLSQYILNDINMGLRPDDCVMLVMPMCHINSIFYSFTYTYVSARVFVYNMISFDPVDLLKTIEKEKITFTSLVPTHYIMMLSLPDEVKKSINVSSMRQLLISSAPARKDTKMAIMDYFKNAELWEAYGSTEAGLVTLLRPEEQFKKLGSIGREIWGTDRIKIMDENGKEVPRGQVGELYSRTPHIFKEYWKDPEKTKSAFQGEWFSAGDMAFQDEDGYFTLVDRKANMIITGGENVFPSEIENILGSHPAVKYVAVIGIPHEKWGEAVKAVVTLHQGKTATEKELIDSCRGKIAGYKIPKSVDFIKDEEMPMTPTGKILHRILREKYGKWSDVK